jgi:DNA-binding transcriptional LysR family regulator
MAGRGDQNWDDLRYFLRAAHSGSLSGAARTLGVEHTTVGRRLLALERSLGASLVMRRPDGLRLTQLGERLVPLAQDIERAIAAIGELVASHQARVRLATPSGFTKFFSESLAQLRKDHPEISLEIVGGALAVDLRRGEAHLAIRVGPIEDESLIVRKLGEAGFSLYASEAYLARRPAPHDSTDLIGHELIGYDPTLSSTPAARWIEAHAAGAAVILRCRDMTDVLSAVLGGVGLAVLPCALGDENPELKRMTDDVIATSPLSLVYAREARIAEPVRVVIRFVVGVVRQHMRRIGGARDNRNA